MNPIQGRRFDIDWLRLLTICCVYLFHCARFFDEYGWHVKNVQSNFGMTVFVNTFAQWIMPTFFILSGLATYYGLNIKRGGGGYLWIRFKRLMIPFIFAVFTMIPLQVYYERVSHSQFVGSFIDFFPHYYDGFYGFGGNFAWMGLHLWYLLFLFVFTLLTFPLFAFLKKPEGQHIIVLLADFLTKPGMILLLFLFTAAIDFGFMPNSLLGLRDMGGWNLLTYLLLYIYGYIFAGDDRFKNTIQEHRRIALTFVLVTVSLLYYWMAVIGTPSAGYNSSYLIFTLLRCLNSWSIVVTLLGFGSKYLNFSNNLLKYATELILPFYILHQTIIITIGFYVVQWNISIGIKYLFISTSSLVIIMLLYELLIKRIDVLRLLFGLKMKIE
ncbi:acyltransferase family protein [Macellibacteroides fermentans]|uniref:acyltransferase family protein n=1 Tax=Macellibacteroides fermentans TaxID=879969 RepID=UPI00406CAC41